MVQRDQLSGHLLVFLIVFIDVAIYDLVHDVGASTWSILPANSIWKYFLKYD